MVPVSQTRHSIYKNESEPFSRVFRVLRVQILPSKTGTSSFMR